MSKRKSNRSSKPWYERSWHEPMDSVDQFSLIYSTGNTIRHEWMSILLVGYAALYILGMLLFPSGAIDPANVAPTAEKIPVVVGTLDDVTYEVVDANLAGEKATVELIVENPDGISSFLKPFHDVVLQLNPDVKEADIIVYDGSSDKKESRPSFKFQDGEILSYHY